MTHRFLSFLFTLFFLYMVAVLLFPISSAQAQVTVDYNFEDGVLRGNPTSMKVPPEILTENGNKFMRITGSAGDKESIPASQPNRNRSTVRFLSHQDSMPLISDSNRRQTYSADIRLYNNAYDAVAFELFQSSPSGPGEGYGTLSGYGPVFIMWRKSNGHVVMRHNYSNETKYDPVDVGYIAPGTWHTYTVKAVWSHDPSVGSLEFYVDGTLKKKITGRDSNVGSDSNRLPTMKLGLYGDYAVGVIDVDNVKAHPSQGPVQTPTPTPTPTGSSTPTPTGSATPTPAPTPTPIPKPIITLNALPTTLSFPGQSTYLIWNASNATSCTASGSWSGPRPPGGGTAVFTPTVTSTYTLTCSGPGGTASAAVTVTPAGAAGGYCHLYTAGSTIPPGFGVPWDVTNPSSLLLKAQCTGAGATLTLGDDQPLTYIYRNAHLAKAGATGWSPVSLFGGGLISNAWFPRTASASVSMTSSELSQTSHYAGYVCKYNAGWKCGCRDTSCTQSYWQIQSFKR
jgi:cell division septation protein DedD